MEFILNYSDEEDIMNVYDGIHNIDRVLILESNDYISSKNGIAEEDIDEDEEIFLPDEQLCEECLKWKRYATIDNNEIGYGNILGLSSNLKLEEILKILKEQNYFDIGKDNKDIDDLIRTILSDFKIPQRFSITSTALVALHMASETFCKDIHSENSLIMKTNNKRSRRVYKDYCYGEDINGNNKTLDLLIPKSDLQISDTIDEIFPTLKRRRLWERQQRSEVLNQYFNRFPNECLQFVKSEEIIIINDSPSTEKVSESFVSSNMLPVGIILSFLL